MYDYELAHYAESTKDSGRNFVQSSLDYVFSQLLLTRFIVIYFIERMYHMVIN